MKANGQGITAMKVYIVSSGCVFEGGADRHVALTEARAIELAEALVKAELVEFEADEYEVWHVWERNDNHPTVLSCEGDSRRVAFWRGGDDFVAVRAWEVDSGHATIPIPPGESCAMSPSSSGAWLLPEGGAS